MGDSSSSGPWWRRKGKTVDEDDESVTPTARKDSEVRDEEEEGMEMNFVQELLSASVSSLR